jgi:hypothetical protein
VVLQLVKKRFGLSDAELTEIGDRIGNSLSAISKGSGTCNEQIVFLTRHNEWVSRRHFAVGPHAR